MLLGRDQQGLMRWMLKSFLAMNNTNSDSESREI